MRICMSFKKKAFVKKTHNKAIYFLTQLAKLIDRPNVRLPTVLHYLYFNHLLFLSTTITPQNRPIIGFDAR